MPRLLREALRKGSKRSAVRSVCRPDENVFCHPNFASRSERGRIANLDVSASSSTLRSTFMVPRSSKPAAVPIDSRMKTPLSLSPSASDIEACDEIAYRVSDDAQAWIKCGHSEAELEVDVGKETVASHRKFVVRDSNSSPGPGLRPPLLSADTLIFP